MTPPPGSHAAHWSVVARCAGAVILAGSIAACRSGSGDAIEPGPTYAPVDAGVCDEITPLLDDVQVTLGVTLEDDDVIYHEPIGSTQECYFRLNSAGSDLYPHATLWVMMETTSSLDVDPHYRQAQEVIPEIGQRFEPGSAVSVDGIGEQAVAFARTRRAFDEGWSVYRVVSRDRNLVLRVDLFVVDEVRLVPRETMADLVDPLAADILALLPGS